MRKRREKSFFYGGPRLIPLFSRPWIAHGKTPLFFAPMYCPREPMGTLSQAMRPTTTSAAHLVFVKPIIHHRTVTGHFPKIRPASKWPALPLSRAFLICIAKCSGSSYIACIRSVYAIAGNSGYCCASPFHTASYPATGALPTLYLSPTRFSHSHRLLSGYICVACSLPLSDALLPFTPLAIRLQVRCLLSTSVRCASPRHAASYPATGALPALYLSPTRFSHSHR